jgi:DNA polymerase-4
MTTKLVACVTMPHFLIHVARQQESLPPTQPTAVATDATDRAIIIDVCSRAASHGIHAGMSAFVARQRCRDVAVVTVDPEAAEQVAASVEAVLMHYTDVVVRRALGCWLLDLVALGRQYAHAEAEACRIQHAMAQLTSWTCGIGLGSQRIVALVAAQFADARRTRKRIVVLPGTEAAFFAPLSVRMLPGIGEQTEAMLARLGITTIGQLATLPESMLVQLVGSRGRTLSRHAQGLDSEIEDPQHITFTSVWRWGRSPTTDRRQILARTYRLTERLGRRLRAQALAAGTMTVRVRWIDGRQRQATHRFTTRRDLDRDLAYGSRTILTQVLAERRLAVAEVAVSIGDVGPRQSMLFEEDSRIRQQQCALDQIKQCHGTSAILHAWLLSA